MGDKGMVLTVILLLAVGLTAAVSHESRKSHHRHHHKRHSALVSHHVDSDSLEEAVDVNEVG